MIISQHHPCPIFCPMPLLLCLHCFDAILFTTSIFFIFLVHRYGKQYPGFGTLTVHMYMKDTNWSDDPTNVITSHGYFSLFILVCKIVALIHYCYRNWPRYSLSWSGYDSADCISGQFLFYHNHNFTKSKGNLRFRRLVSLFVPIGVCVTTHNDGTASDVTINLWRQNQQATNHERNSKPCFSLPK